MQNKKLRFRDIALGLICLLLITVLAAQISFLYDSLVKEPAGFSHQQLISFEKSYWQADYCVLLDTTKLRNGQKIYGELCGSIIYDEKTKRHYILTVAHIALSGETILDIKVFFRKYPPQKARLVGYHRSLDLALLEFSDPNFIYVGPVAQLGSSANLKEGDKIMVIGRSEYYHEKSLGMVVEPWSSALSHDELVTTSSAKPGYSGGPMLNEKGELVAITIIINKNFYSGDTTFTMGTPADKIKAVLNDLRDGLKQE